MRIIDILMHILVNNPANTAYLINCRNDLQTSLLPLLMSFSHQIRLHVLRVLSVINSNLVDSADHTDDSHQCSNQIFLVQNIVERCLKAERIQLGPQTVRDFLMHVLQLHSDRDVKHCRQAAEIAIHYLFGLLHIQFTAIWSPVYEAIASYCESIPLLKKKSTVREISSNNFEYDDKHWSIECRDLFWSIFQPLLMDVEAKVVDTDDNDIQEVSDSNETNLYTCSYETAIIWFTSIRPDLYSLLRKSPKNDILLIESRKPPNWLSYRLCLWQCLRWKVAAKYTHFLTPLLLNIINSAIQSGLSKSTEQEQIEKIIDLQSFRDTVRTFRLDTSLFSPEHREYIGGILLRILYGRLQLSKGQFTSAIFTNLGLCTDSELNLFLSFLLDPFVKETDCGELCTNSSITTLTTSKTLYDSIQLARQRVQQTVHGGDTLSWSRLHALSQVINQLLNYLGHRLNIINLNENELINTTDNEFQSNPTDLSNDIQRADILLRLALTLLVMVYEVKQIKLDSLIKPVNHPPPHRPHHHHHHHHHGQLPLTSQLKSIRSASINLLIHLFSSKWLCNIQFWGKSITITTNDNIDNNDNNNNNNNIERSTIVKYVCCNHIVLMNLLNSSTLSLNHLIIQLSYVWSLNEYLCIKFFDKSLLHTLLTLLNMHYHCTLKLNNEIIEKLIEIIHNLIFLPGVCTIGRKLLQPYHSELITYLNKRLQELCQAKSTFFINLGKKPQSGLRLQHEFQLISYLAQLPYTNIDTDNKQPSTSYLTQVDGEKLLEALLQLLQRSSIRSFRRTTATIKPALFKRLSSGNLVNSDESAARYDLQLATGEAIEAELIQSILHLVQIATNITDYLKKILDLFVRSKSRIARSLLCQVVGVCTSHLSNWPFNLYESLKTLNNHLENEKEDSIKPIEHINDNLRYFKKYLLCNNQSMNTLNNLTQDILLMLNSWDSTHIEQPDVNKRDDGFSLLIELCLLFKLDNPPEQTIFLHRAGLNCAIYTLSHDDLQLRDTALDYATNCIQAIHYRIVNQHSNDCEADIYYQELIVKCLWPNLVAYLQDTSISLGPKRLHLLRLLNCIIHTYSSNVRFAPLALLCDNHSLNNDFYTNLQSGTISRQSCAIRRLSLFLRNPLTIISRRQLNKINSHQQSLKTVNLPISQKDLRSVILPIIWFYLEPELNSSIDYNNCSNLSEHHKKLIDYCLDALGALAKYLHWKSYRSLLESMINRLNTCINTNLASQILVNLIDAFQPPNWKILCNDDDDEVKAEEDKEMEDINDNMMRCKMILPYVKSSSKPTEDQGESSMILNYMLSVVKRLEPFIVKPIKINDDINKNSATNQPLKISLVISLVMLLRRLPPGYLESRLPHLILRVIDILRPSRDINFHIRNEASKSLSRIGRLLGPSKALDKLFEVVSQQLDRGGYASWQVRLYALHRVLGEVEQAITSGEVSFKPGQLDNIGRILSHLYLDEMIGRLAEEMDSRRSGGISESRAKEFSVSDLSGSINTDLPEANGLKSPEGVTRLCRLLSADGVVRLFMDIKTALTCAASGTTLESVLNNSQSTNISIGCGLRFRHRALARLECTLTRLSTKNGIFSNKFLNTNVNIIHNLFQQLVNENIEYISMSNNDNAKQVNNLSPVIDTVNNNNNNSTKGILGWCQSQSKLLEPRWKYLELDNEPIHEQNILTSQSNLTQLHLMVCCGLHLFIGLIRYHWLKLDDLDHLQMINNFIPSIIICLNSKYVQVLSVTVQCIRLLLLIATSKSTIHGISKFYEYLNQIGEKLFDVLANQPSLLSNKTLSSNYHAQNLSTSLYRTLASLVRHQYSYTLSRSQLLTLLNTIDIELNRDIIISPCLSLLHAILQRRLRDPTIKTIENDLLSFIIDPEVSKDLPLNGLVIAKLSDCDYEQNTGAGGGSRLLDLFSRLQVLAITSPSEQIRAESRCCLITFLLNYPHKVKFLQSFIAFCVRQLEYKKVTGRLSAASLLYCLISDLPITRLMGSNHLDEVILLSVAAAIERESARKSRMSLLNLIRLLFSKLPIDAAQSYFNDYLLAFLTAPPETRCSARLLGLQMITYVLNAQPCLSINRYRTNLIDILSNDVLPIAAIQLNNLVHSNPSLIISTGLSALYNKDLMKTPKEECTLAHIVKEDAKWMSELKLPTVDSSNDDPEIDDDDDDDASTLAKDDEEQESSSDDERYSDRDNVDLDYDEDAGLDPFAASAETFGNDDLNRVDINATQSDSISTRKLKCSKSAIDNQYYLIAYTLEYTLKLIYQLIIGSNTDCSTDTTTVDNNLDMYISSMKLSTFWHILLNGPKYNLSNGIIEFQTKKHQNALNKRRQQYSTLFSTEILNRSNKVNNKLKTSLLVIGHRETREWSTRCLKLLLKLEVNANQDRFIKQSNIMNSELSGFNARSSIFKKFQKRKSSLSKVLHRLLDGLLFQLEMDARVPISDEWSDSLISNLIYLGQLLHLTVGRKSVLRIFRIANKIALDELNNRPQYYCQRILALKLTTGLLLRLPHPNTNQLFEMLSLTKPSDALRDKSQSADSSSVNKQVPAYFAYLRSASKLISREYRQRELLAFTAASSLATAVNDDTTEIGARIRLRGSHLSRELTVRAKSRRRRAQARLRRALMSGTIRPETANSLVASVSAGMAKAGPDQLIELIESTESALTQELGGGNHQLIQIICSRASLGARVIRERRKLHKATRNALGIAWNGPIKKQPNLDIPQPLEMNSVSTVNESITKSKQSHKRKRSPELNQKMKLNKQKKSRISL
ncbi:hypothetical protein MN116_008055 [Schistosoma mekongi]|uniref:Uncharacterized protein n=1 Tax=Schistosoma mekongi TaxID=38744 RepID=A0AAE2D2N5_SCHME|nr:hypothetical protein MN116_008055 [Schistosoma mekongi]